MDGYRISEHFAQRLKATVLKVDRIPDASGGDGRIPVLHEETRRGPPVRLGRTYQNWAKNTQATIMLMEKGAPTDERSTTSDDPNIEYLEGCVNKMTAVPANKWVIVARAGNGYYYLIAAEC